MSAKHLSQGGAYRINLKLDPRDDADIIAWLASFRSGQRSSAVRETIRRGLRAATPVEADIDLESIRQIVADELSRSLAGLRLQAASNQDAMPVQDIESEYGSKLDRMLGGVSQRSLPDPDNP